MCFFDLAYESVLVFSLVFERVKKLMVHRSTVPRKIFVFFLFHHMGCMNRIKQKFSFFLFKLFNFVLNKIKYTTYIKYSITICGLAVGPLVKTGHARIVIRAVAVSQAEFTNC